MANLEQAGMTMETKRGKIPLGTIIITYIVVLLLLAALTNYPRGVYADIWVIPIIMAVFGLIGGVIGTVLGGIIGLIGKLFNKNSFIPGLKYGAAFGFMGVLVLWILNCWMNGSGVCLVQ